jgi:thymidylate synthase
MYALHKIPHYETQYLDILRDVMDNGYISENKRTGQVTKSVIGRTIVLDVANDPYPAITTRKAPIILPIAEKVGYLQGLNNAQDFDDIGSPTWFRNANHSKAWLENPNRKGENDLGYVYGVFGRRLVNQFGETFDQLAKVVNNLKQGIDDRGEIITYFDPSMHKYGALRACMHTHNFALQGDTLYLESYQRSSDLPLGAVANIQQVYLFLKLMAHITGKKPGIARLHMTNCHVYEPQFELAYEQLKRTPYFDVKPQLHIDPSIKTLADIEALKDMSKFKVTGYDKYHPAIKYPFSD